MYASLSDKEYLARIAQIDREVREGGFKK